MLHVQNGWETHRCGRNGTTLGAGRGRGRRGTGAEEELRFPLPIMLASRCLGVLYAGFSVSHSVAVYVEILK